MLSTRVNLIVQKDSEFTAAGDDDNNTHTHDYDVLSATIFRVFFSFHFIQIGKYSEWVTDRLSSSDLKRNAKIIIL